VTPIARELLAPSLDTFGRSPLSPREDAVYQFLTMVANGYLEGGVARPASRATV